MADQERKLQESAPEKERFADQQFGATAARDQTRLEAGEHAQYGDPSTDTDADGGTPESKPRAGNKAKPA